LAAQAEVDIVATELERTRNDVPVLFDREGQFYSAIEKRDVEIISNRQMRGPLEIRPGGKFRFFDPNGGDMGRGSGPKFDKFVLSPQHIAYAVEYTMLTKWVTDDKRKAVIDNFQRNFASAMKEFRRHCDAMAVGAGDGGHARRSHRHHSSARNGRHGGVRRTAGNAGKARRVDIADATGEARQQRHREVDTTGLDHCGQVGDGHRHRCQHGNRGGG